MATNRNAADFSQRKISDNVSEYTKQLQDRAEDIVEEGRTAVRRFDANTVPDAFRNVPKMISPRVHAWLDVAVVSYFVTVAGWCAVRGKFSAALAGLVNAGMVAGVSLMTDYDGDGRRPISFKLHGTLDAAQAATAGLAPVLHGFADEPEAAFFYGQALNEVGVIATTDWDAGMRRRSRRRAA